MTNSGRRVSLNGHLSLEADVPIDLPLSGRRRGVSNRACPRESDDESELLPKHGVQHPCYSCQVRWPCIARLTKWVQYSLASYNDGGLERLGKSALSR